MSLTFTGSIEKLKEILKSIGGTWNDDQPTKKVLRYKGAVMNWYTTTGTLQFQGKPASSQRLKSAVQLLLNNQELPPAVKSFLTPEAAVAPENAALKVAENETVDKNTESNSSDFLSDNFNESEIIIGLVSAVGTEVKRITEPLMARLNSYGYTNTSIIQVSSILPVFADKQSEYKRIRHYMAEGDKLREKSKNNGVLAYGAAKLINASRPTTKGKRAYIINSLKHPDEVSALRKIYGQGFYLIGIHSDKKRRVKYLIEEKQLIPKEADELISIDEDEKIKHGQKTRDTFHLSDFYFNVGQSVDQVTNSVQRFLDLLFSHPYKNPTFDEFAMYMAFSSSVRSGDLSRQVGAIIAKNNQIIATGANEVPSAGGGHYWAEVDKKTGEVKDILEGKDYMRGEDSNKAEQREIIESLANAIGAIKGLDEELLGEIRSKLENSRIKDLTEFGRVVHAEMQAILSCAKEGISCSDSVLYCTTFPCHNCAKHLIAAGIKRVVYVEPYDKSKALDFHNESITIDPSASGELVLFEPFIGVGARRFLDFFSMTSGAGSKLKRKDSDGEIIDWNPKTAKLRVILLPESYLEIEKSAIEIFDKCQ